MGTSKKELCAASIYYLCIIMGVEETILKDLDIKKLFDNLIKLDYEEVCTLYNDLKSIYNNIYIWWGGINMYHCSRCWREIGSYEYYTYDGLCSYCRYCYSKNIKKLPVNYKFK